MEYAVYSYGPMQYPAKSMKIALRSARALCEMRRFDNFFIGKLQKNGKYETVGVAYWVPNVGAIFQKDTVGSERRFICKDGTLGKRY